MDQLTYCSGGKSGEFITDTKKEQKKKKELSRVYGSQLVQNMWKKPMKISAFLIYKWYSIQFLPISPNLMSISKPDMLIYLSSL